MGRQLELCGSCLNSVCIIDYNLLQCVSGGVSKDDDEKSILYFVMNIRVKVMEMFLTHQTSFSAFVWLGSEVCF